MKSSTSFRLAAFLLTAVAVCLTLVALRPVPPRSVPIRNACNTFVAQVSPLATPALRRSEHGLFLHISFTPAKDEEADAITKAVEAGTRELVIYPGKQTIEAAGIQHHDLVLAVNSHEHAKAILRLLCFSNKDGAPDVPLQLEQGNP